MGAPADPIEGGGSPYPRQTARFRGSASYWLPILAVAFAGITATIVAYGVTNRIADRELLRLFTLRVDWRATDLQDDIAAYRVPQFATAIHVAAENTVDLADFDRFANAVRGAGTPVAALDWVPLVTRAQRTGFEASEGIQISERTADGKAIPAADRDEYAPVMEQTRFGNAPSSRGYDMLSDPNRRRAADLARDTGQPHATFVPLALLPGLLTYVSFWPVYANGYMPATVAERREELRGFVIGVYRIVDVLTASIANSPAIPEAINFYLGDATTDDGTAPVSGVPIVTFSPTEKTFAAASTRPYPTMGAYRFVRTFVVMGQRWRVESVFPPEAIAAERSIVPQIILFAGLLVTGLVAAYFARARAQVSLIQAEVAERTRELRESTGQWRRTTEQMTAIIDASPIAVIALDAARNLTVWNRAAEMMFGYESAEVIGRPPPAGFIRNNEELSERFARLELGDLLINQNAKRGRKDGTTIDTTTSAAAFFDPAGVLQGFVALIEDVTEKNATAAALRRTQTLLTEIVASSNDAMISKTLDGIVTSWNHGAERVFGYGAAEMIGKPISVLAVPGHEDDMSVVLGRIRRGERVDSYETQRRRKDGVIIDISLTVSPVHDDQGRIIGASKIARDISQSKAALSALRESELQYRATFDIAQVGIMHVKPHAKFLMVNDYLCKLLGYGLDELREKTPFEITHPDDRAESIIQSERLYNGNASTASLTKRYVRRDGSPVWCEITMAAMPDESGRTSHIISVVRDLSATRAAAERRTQLEKQLQQSQKMEAIGQLTGDLAHDFNNLLGVVLGNLDILQDSQEAGSDQRALTDAAIHAAVRGAELTRQLLAFARKQPLASKLTDLNAVLEGSTQLLRRTLGEYITLELKISGGLWTVLIDASQLESAILNLAVNARDAMPKGGKLTMEAENITLDEGADELNPEAMPGDYVAVAVSDTGTGMPPEVLAKVFEPFFTTKGSKGTGLGLSMVHGFVKQSGGHTKIYTEPGRGTTIRMYLPRAREAESEAEIGLAAPPLNHGNEVILVVEDNKGLREVALRHLHGFGYRTIPASDAAQALEIIQGGAQIDLMFTDVVMPGGMDGRALAEAARRLRPGLKVLFTSGFTAAAASAAMTDEFGFNLLSKPYRKEELGRRIKAAIDSAGG